MKKLFLMVVAAMMAIGASAQTTVKMIRVYEGNTVVYEQQYAAVDSVVFFDEIIPAETNGALPGEFSVSAHQKVKFSKGNLQYVNSTWQFADNQWDFQSSQSANYRDKFAWGTGDDPARTGTTADYSTFHDWGANPISNGGNEANMWRTLTKDEWTYLFCDRTNASKLFSLGTVKGRNGVIILPDNWVTPDSITFNPNRMGLYSNSSGGSAYTINSTTEYTRNTYDETQWLTMQANGAVFLPAATDYNGQWVGGYWSATSGVKSGYPNLRYSLDFDKTWLCPQFIQIEFSEGYITRAVRLVQDAE